MTTNGDQAFFSGISAAEPYSFTFNVYADDAIAQSDVRVESGAIPVGETGTFFFSTDGLGAADEGGSEGGGSGGLTGPNVTNRAKYRLVSAGSGSQYWKGTVTIPALKIPVPDLRQEDFGFGPGWNLAGIERIVAPPSQFIGSAPIYWIRSDGYVLTFPDLETVAEHDENANVIYYTGSQFALSDKFGNTTVFREDGWIQKRIDRYGNVTEFHYQDANEDGIPEINFIKNNYDRQVIRFEDTVGDDGLIDVIRTYPDDVVPFGPDDELFRETQLAYDSSGRLYSIAVPIDADAAEPDWATTYFSYDADGRLASVTDADGKTTGFEYQSDGDVVTTTYHDGTSTKLIRTRPSPFEKVHVRRVLNASGFGGGGHVGRLSLPILQKVSLVREGVFIDELGRTSTFKTDETGYVVETTDAAGRVTKYKRNEVGQITAETLLESNEKDAAILDQMFYTYDGQFNRTSVVYIDGTSEHWTYGDLSRVTAYTDQLGRQTTYTYVNHPAPSIAEKEVEVRQIVGLNDTEPGVAENNDIVTTYIYSVQGQLVEKRERRVDADGFYHGDTVTQFEYTVPIGDLRDFEDPPINTDPINGLWLKKIIFAEGTADEAVYEILEFDEFGNPLVVSQSVDATTNRVTEYEYDDMDRVKKITYPDPGDGQARAQTTFTYTDTSRLDTRRDDNVADPDSYIVTSYLYDHRHRLEQISIYGDDNIGRTTTYAYDAAGNLRSANADGLNRLTRFNYDILDRPIRIDEPTGAVTLLAYDALGRLVARQTPQGNVTNYEYDKRHRLTRMIAPLGATDVVANGVTEYTYDAAGQLTAMIDPEGRVTKYVYDDAGRLGEIHEPLPDEEDDHAPIVFQYDTLSNLQHVTDALNHETTYSYDALSRLVSEIDANLDETSYTYNDLGELRTLTDPEDNVTEWEYDGAGRVASETNELDDTRTYEYDEFNRLIEVVDRNGRGIKYKYDSLGRMTEEQWYANDQFSSPTRTIEYGYNDTDELTSASDDSFNYSLTVNRDGLGNADFTSQSMAGLSGPVTFDHDFDGYLLKETSATINGTYDFVNTYEYDALDRLTQIKQTDNGGNSVADKRVELRYDADGRLDFTAYFASLDVSQPVSFSFYFYDGRGRLSAITHHGNTLGTFESKAHSYQYDDANRLIEYGQKVGAASELETLYSYDDRGQLTGVNYVGDFFTDEDYTYDDNGNRLQIDNHAGLDQDYSYDDPHNNLIESDDVYLYEYDGEGNRVRRIDLETGDYQTIYAYDHRNRLVSVQEWYDYDDLLWQVDYVYDPFNQLIKRTVDPDGDQGTAAIDQTFYLYDQGQVVLEFNKTGTGTVQVSDLSHRYLWGPAVDQLFADEQLDNGDTYWMLTDNLGSIRDVLDSDGNLRIHRDFDSFGNINGVNGEIHYDENGDEVTSGADYIDEAFAFTGRFLDEETGLQNNLNRWYDPATGRWVSEDPIGFTARDVNLARYVGNESTRFFDPNGLVQSIVRPEYQEQSWLDWIFDRPQYLTDHGVAEFVFGPGEDRVPIGTAPHLPSIPEWPPQYGDVSLRPEFGGGTIPQETADRAAELADNHPKGTDETNEEYVRRLLGLAQDPKVMTPAEARKYWGRLIESTQRPLGLRAFRPNAHNDLFQWRRKNPTYLDMINERFRRLERESDGWDVVQGYRDYNLGNTNRTPPRNR